ncbi:MAG TPA: ABC transporter permease [Bryobacteraceae bacterium]|nr:ABC transporter permease [Bryobacteraceae bacterium]
MLPIPCRFMLTLAGLMVPRKQRAEWRQEWDAELSYRVRCGADLAYLVRSARGAFRDAWWIRSQNPPSFAFLKQPLRAEALALAIALITAICTGALFPPHPNYKNLDRLVRLERNVGRFGVTVPFIRPSLIRHWKESSKIEAVASYVIVGRLSGRRAIFARVSPNFFDVLGVNPQSGHLTRADDETHDAVITNTFWRTRLHGDPHAIGAHFREDQDYRVVGILPPGIAFRGVSFFSRMTGINRMVTAIALLRPGVSDDDAREELVAIARHDEPAWMADGIRLHHLVSTTTVTSLFLIGAFLTLLVAYFCWRKRVFRPLLCARIATTVLSVLAFNLATLRPVAGILGILALAQTFLCLGLCVAAVYLILRDHSSRCRTCFERLQMPVPIGSWSSLIINRPTTEYLCPKGHGALVVSEALHDPDQWTTFDESWQDLFAETADSRHEP